ncbi:metal transporter [Cupriavidus sp. TMH.W2]|uniref:metal transporter n=1 Tax=Cupriavidus sp. TMH.W2 TaxID=3434465 RepID=UPI003D77E970
MSRRTLLKGLQLLLPAILAALVLGGFLLSRGEQASEAAREAPVRSPVRVAVENGLTMLTVDDAAQARSGIQLQALDAIQPTTGTTVYGTVIDLQPLVDLMSRYAASAADLESAKAAAEAARAELERTQALYADVQNASLKTLQAARSANAAATAKVKSLQANMSGIVASAQQQYGAIVSSWALSTASPELAHFLERREVLLRIVFPGGQTGAAPAMLKATGDNITPFDARLVSAAPQVDPGIQGQAYFYRAAAPLATGARISARAPATAAAKAGVLIPASAIVWYGGQPWAFVQTGKDQFQRRAVDPRFPQDGDFFAIEGFKPGDSVVVRGAQLLLSEESRAQAGSQPENE